MPAAVSPRIPPFLHPRIPLFFQKSDTCVSNPRFPFVLFVCHVFPTSISTHTLIPFRAHASHSCTLFMLPLHRTQSLIRHIHTYVHHATPLSLSLLKLLYRFVSNSIFHPIRSFICPTPVASSCCMRKLFPFCSLLGSSHVATLYGYAVVVDSTRSLPLILRSKKININVCMSSVPPTVIKTLGRLCLLTRTTTQ